MNYYICLPCQSNACHSCRGCSCAEDNHGAGTCFYCGESIAGDTGCYYSLDTGYEVCAKSPTTFHEQHEQLT